MFHNIKAKHQRCRRALDNIDQEMEYLYPGQKACHCDCACEDCKACEDYENQNGIVKMFSELLWGRP